MQSSRGLLSLPSSSGNSLVSSRTNSNASLSRAYGYEDELESYLSLVAGGGKKKSQKKGEKRASAAVDWGRLLDSQQCEKTQKKVAEEEEVETDGDGNIKQFLKPKSIPEVRSEKTEKDAPGPSNSPNQSSSTQKIIPQQIVPHTVDSDFTDSISMTDLSSDSEQGLDKMIQHKNIMSTATEQLKVDTRAPGDLCEALGPQDQETRIERQQPSSALTRSLRMSGADSSPTDDDTSSISQDLGLSSHFRNNIFTVEELEPLDSVLDKNSTIVDPPGADCTDSATSEDRLVASESSPQGNIVQLHNIVSLADLDSLPAESRIKLPHIVVKAPSDTVSQSVFEERGRENSKEQSDGLNFTSDGSEDTAYLTGEGKESVNTSKSDEYEEDFEEETLESAASPSGSSPDREVSAESETAGDSGSESGEDYSSLQTQSEQTTTCDSHSKDTVVLPSSNGAVAADEQISSTAPRSKAKEFAVLEEPIDSQQSQKDGPGVASLPLPARRPLTLPEFPSLPHHSSLLPHLPTNTTVSPHVSIALEELVHCQLALTRSLVARSRSLAQYLADSFTPDYHYTTLEDTKKYISQHRPRVLTKEEAQKLVSQENEL